MIERVEIVQGNIYLGKEDQYPKNIGQETQQIENIIIKYENA